MKCIIKYLCSFLLLVGLFVIPMDSNAYQQISYPKHLYNNNQIVEAYHRQSVGVYVDKTSIVNQIYNPPYYKLAANVIYYDFTHNKELFIETDTFEYDYNTKNVHIVSNHRGDRGILNKNHIGMATQKEELQIANIVWKAIYNTKF